MPTLERRRFAALSAAFVATWALPASADIFVYTDEKGVRHFTNKRPKGGGKRKKFKLYARSKPRKRKRAPGVSPVAPSDRSRGRFTRYDRWIRQAATLYQIPEALVRAVIKVESDYDPRAVSSAGAQGLMQLMPATARHMRVRDPHDPKANIFAGTRYLRILANGFNGDLSLTIAGYNAGPGAVRKYGGVPPYDETQLYVLKVLQYYHRYRSMRDATMASM